MKKLFIFILLAMVAFCSCNSDDKKSNNENCSSIYQPSYLCKVADSYGVDIEYIGEVLVVPNIERIGDDSYKRGRCLEAFKQLRSILNDPISYKAVKLYIEFLSLRSSNMLIVDENFLESLDYDIFYHLYDQALLKKWIEAQIELLED